MTHEEYMRVAGFWESKDEEAKAPCEVIEAAFSEYVRNEKACVLATGSGAYVRATPVHYAFHSGCFYIFSEGGMKFKSLEENENVSLAIFDTKGDFGHLKSVQIMGKAELIDPDSKEYAGICELRKISVDAIRRLSYTMHLIKVIPNEIIMVDSGFKKAGYGNRQRIRL